MSKSLRSPLQAVLFAFGLRGWILAESVPNFGLLVTFSFNTQLQLGAVGVRAVLRTVLTVYH